MDFYIRLRGVGKRYDTKNGAVEACSDVTLDIRRSEFVAIVGPSGCGKTTLLKMVAGLVPYTSGTISVGGKQVDRPLTDVGVVFQESILLDWRDVLSNVMLQIEIRGVDRQTYEPRARDLLKATGLEGFENKKPYELSGGMRQRVSICRALVHLPQAGGEEPARPVAGRGRAPGPARARDARIAVRRDGLHRAAETHPGEVESVLDGALEPALRARRPCDGRERERGDQRPQDHRCASQGITPRTRCARPAPHA